MIQFNNLYNLKAGLLVLVALLGFSSAQAATFTAVASGDWTASSTWQGGLAPGTSINADDDVVIGSGFTVNLDTDVTVNGFSVLLPGGSIAVDGTLTSTNNSTLFMNNGDLTGSGTIDLDRLQFAGLSSFGFSGNAIVKTFVASNASLTLGSMVDVTDTLRLQSGVLTIGATSIVDLQTNAIVVVDEGSISSSGGLFSSVSSYHALYVGSSKDAGMETSASGLSNVIIDLDDNNQTLSLTSDMETMGNLEIMSGNLDLNGNNLTLMGDYVAQSGTSIEGDSNSDLIVESASTLTSDFEFASGGQELNSLQLNFTAMSTANLASNLMIMGELVLGNGNLDITNNGMLTMDNNSTVHIENGSITESMGSFNGNFAYHVMYTGGTKPTGVEFEGSGLTNVMIDLSNTTDKVTLSSDSEIGGNLDLSSGNLDLNSYDLTLNGDLTAGNNTAFMGDAGSSLMLTNSGGVSSNLVFMQGSQQLYNLMVDVSNGNSTTLASDLMVNNSLMLTSGTLNIDNNSTLTLENNSEVVVNTGSMATVSGMFDGSNSYTVMYTGASNSTGMELSGSGLTQVDIDLDNVGSSVTLSDDVSINAALNLNTGMLSLNGNDLMISGSLSTVAGATIEGDAASNLEINNANGLTSTLMFASGSENLNNLTVNSTNNGNVMLASDLSIGGELMLSNGNLEIGNNGMLMMESGSQVMVTNGAVVAAGGSFDGSASYNVSYMGNTTQTGAELTGSGMNNLTVNLGNTSDTLMLMSDATSNGTIDLQSGNVALNGNTLTIMGDYAATSNTMLWGDSNAGVEVMSATALSSSLMFNSNANELNSFTVNITDGSNVMLDSDLIVSELSLSSGSVVITDNNLMVAQNGTVTGGSSDSYVLIDGQGALQMNIEGGSGSFVEFPVGTDEGFGPAAIMYNGSNNVAFMINTANGVWTEGNSGSELTIDQAVVDRTWNVTSEAGSSTDIDLMVMWSSDMEVNSFNNNEAYISHYTEGNWDATATASASTTTNGMFSLTREGITSLSPFAVFDKSTTVGLNELTALNVEVYPNPASSTLFVQLETEPRATVELVDLSGKIMQREVTNGTNRLELDLSGLPQGVYMLRILGDNSYTVERIVKS